MILEQKRVLNVIFQALIEKSVSFICSENPNTQNLRLTEKLFISENFLKTKKLSLQKHSCHKSIKYIIFFPKLIFPFWK